VEIYNKLIDNKPGILKQILVTYEVIDGNLVKTTTERKFYENDFREYHSSEVLISL
jgi:hypothetical protein